MAKSRLLVVTTLLTFGCLVDAGFAQTSPAPADAPAAAPAQTPAAAPAQAPAAAAAPAAAPGECSGDASTWSGCSGTLAQKDGSKYVGGFRDGKFDGKGTLTWKDGDQYVGEFKNGLRDGTGAVTLNKVAKVGGRWVKGKYVGQ